LPADPIKGLIKAESRIAGKRERIRKWSFLERWGSFDTILWPLVGAIYRKEKTQRQTQDRDKKKKRLLP